MNKPDFNHHSDDPSTETEVEYQMLPDNCPSAACQHELHRPKIINFDSLVRCGDEVWIENAGQIYRLRRTRNDKLILTK